MDGQTSLNQQQKQTRSKSFAKCVRCEKCMTTNVYFMQLLQRASEM